MHQWLEAKRPKLLNPLSKGGLVFALLLSGTLPCLSGLLIPLVIVVLVLAAIAYLVFSQNDHKAWQIIFLIVVFIGSITLSLSTYSFCSSSRVIKGVSLTQVKEYKATKPIHFKLKDGQVLLDYVFVLDIQGGESVIVGPLVPDVKKWNSSIEVTAWAFDDIPARTDGTEIISEWKDSSLHEGILTFDPALNVAPQLLQKEFGLKAPSNAPVLRWGYTSTSTWNALLITSTVIVCVAFVVVLGLWVADYYFLFKLTRRDRKGSSSSSSSSSSSFLGSLEEDREALVDNNSSSNIVVEEQVYEMQDEPTLEDEEDDEDNNNNNKNN